jgi:hypothetical protein
MSQKASETEIPTFYKQFNQASPYMFCRNSNAFSKILRIQNAEADSREVLLLQHLARIPYPVRPSIGSAKADALWNTVGNISISSPIQNNEQKIYIFFVKRFLVTQWKSCDLWLLCLKALIIELSF